MAANSLLKGPAPALLAAHKIIFFSDNAGD